MRKPTLAYDIATPNADVLFNKHFNLLPYAHKDELNNQVFDILLCRSVLKVDKLFLNQHPELAIIASATSGLCHLDVRAVKQRGIRLLDARGANSPAVCDYVLSVLAHCVLNKKLPIKKIGIIGSGHIGARLAKILRTTGFKIYENDPFRKSSPSFKHSSIETIKHCDFISLHVPYTKTGPHPTHLLIDKYFINGLKKDCVIVNTARGTCLDERALLDASHLHFCCDVFQNEPTVNPNFIKRAMIATPHIAGHAIESKERLSQHIQLKLFEALNITHEGSLSLPPPLKLSLSDALTRYNPIEESLKLQANPSAANFKRLRTQHSFRHEFSFI